MSAKEENIVVWEKWIDPLFTDDIEEEDENEEDENDFSDLINEEAELLKRLSIFYLKCKIPL